jgi:tRNA dimethylallyltransferase
MEKLIIILGPTGIGKTTFAIKLAQKFNGEIVGADSMQIYKYMNIGTAKPEPAETELVPHHLIDFLDPKEEFDAGQYIEEADKAIKKIVSLNMIPIIAGGTGLYIKALQNGLFRCEPISKEILARLEQDLELKGSQALYQQLKECDPIAADKIHPNDSFRIIRALEVFIRSGKKISDYQQKHQFKDSRYQSLKIGLYLDREELYDRINKRVDLMISRGLLNEVASLLEKGYSLNLKSMQSIGYKHMGMYIKNEVDFEEAVRLLKRDTRRYAKRQMTWFRKDPDIVWLTPLEMQESEEIVNNFLAHVMFQASE